MFWNLWFLNYSKALRCTILGNGKTPVAQNSCNLSSLIKQRQEHKKPCSLRFSLHKFVHLKNFWTLFKNVHCQGPCSLRRSISRPYCTLFSKNGPNSICVGSVHNLVKKCFFPIHPFVVHAQLADNILDGFYFLVGREPRRKWKANISFNKIIKHVKRPQSFALLKPGHTALKS